MGGNNCVCLWNRSVNKNPRLVNFKYFWSKVSGTHTPRKELSKQIRQMYLPKHLIFTTENNNYIFTIGIVPTKEFEVLMRLELESNGDYIEMGISEIQQLFVMLHQIFETNIMHPAVLAASTESITSINVKLFQHNTYNLRVEDKQIFITVDGLLTLLKNENCIKILMNTYEIKASLCANTVFQLLDLCCQRLRDNTNQLKGYIADGSSTKNDVNDAIILGCNNRDFGERINLSGILDDLISSPCDCLSITFIIETKVHFENLISRWIGVFYETQLLSEAMRIATFKKKWPHKFIETQTLAKNGFFYVGPFDRVQCVFCKTVLEKWQPTDTVVCEHNRFAPFCSSSLVKAANNIPLFFTG